MAKDERLIIETKNLEDYLRKRRHLKISDGPDLHLSGETFRSRRNSLTSSCLLTLTSLHLIQIDKNSNILGLNFVSQNVLILCLLSLTIYEFLIFFIRMLADRAIMQELDVSINNLPPSNWKKVIGSIDHSIENLANKQDSLQNTQAIDDVKTNLQITDKNILQLNDLLEIDLIMRHRSFYYQRFSLWVVEIIFLVSFL